MSKPDKITGFSEETTSIVEQGLLEIWRGLREYHDHLVLVGGLVPRYLVDQSQSTFKIDRPGHCGSMDVDIGVSLGVGSVQSTNRIRKILVTDMKFHPRIEGGIEMKYSYDRKHGNVTLIVDFLTPKYDNDSDKEYQEVDMGLAAFRTEGLELALDNPLLYDISGQTLSGTNVTETLRMSRVVPFITLKAKAYRDRSHPKDIYDMVYTLRYYKDGPTSVAKEITETERKSAAFRKATDLLSNIFEAPDSEGPQMYANFLAGEEEADRNSAFAAVQEFIGAL